MGHSGVAETVAGSAACLVDGTRLSVTARSGLEDALAAVRTISVGLAPPYVACAHVHTDDLGAALRMLTAALSKRGRPTGARVPDAVSGTELSPPAFDRPGVRYRDAMVTLDRVLPDRVDVVSTPATPARPPFTTCPCAAEGNSWLRSAWAAWGTASAPVSEWRSAARCATARTIGTSS